MKVRGAPAIGVAAAYGMALAAGSIQAANRDEFLGKLKKPPVYLLLPALQQST